MTCYVKRNKAMEVLEVLNIKLHCQKRSYLESEI